MNFEPAKLEISHPPVVLFVDDHPDIQTVITFSLKEFGYHVVGAQTGQKALQAFSQTAIDIAIVDYGLPDMNGIELGRQIRESQQGSDVGLVLFTGSDDSKIRKQGEAVGFDAFLKKPLKMDRLHREIEALLSKSS